MGKASLAIVLTARRYHVICLTTLLEMDMMPGTKKREEDAAIPFAAHRSLANENSLRIVLTCDFPHPPRDILRHCSFWTGRITPSTDLAGARFSLHLHRQISRQHDPPKVTINFDPARACTELRTYLWAASVV